ncbi:hypothetical protein LMTR13_03195 [Bradyrhizobium icense]|uniref:Uncharacterized protein n=1 Tax=Bradyrhizobium icense TaxID=1274631 RepID=A0A1B1U969_9BRAD|nr:hypothetical protein LMTR13_03195 [Bradyrhizobium icense]
MSAAKSRAGIAPGSGCSFLSSFSFSVLTLPLLMVVFLIALALDWTNVDLFEIDDIRFGGSFFL